MLSFNRKYHKRYRKWSVKHGGVKKYSSKWWFWHKKGRKTWQHCKAKGEKSPFWKDKKCDTRKKPSKGSKWWWWTKEGRKTWRQCKRKGELSTFWKEMHCARAR